MVPISAIRSVIETPELALAYPDAVAISDRHVQPHDGEEYLLVPTVSIWLADNTVGDWAFVVQDRTIREPSRWILECGFAVRFVEPFDAFGFKMRWG